MFNVVFGFVIGLSFTLGLFAWVNGGEKKIVTKRDKEIFTKHLELSRKQMVMMYVSRVIQNKPEELSGRDVVRDGFSLVQIIEQEYDNEF